MIGGKHFSDHVGDFMGKSPQPTRKIPTLPPRTTVKKPTRAPKTTRPGPKPTHKPYYENCKGLEDGLYPMRDCTKYIQCVGGKTYFMRCPEGLFFNPKIGACDWPQHVDCKMPKM